jgi:type IV pilus assembly protein PilV
MNKTSPHTAAGGRRKITHGFAMLEALVAMVILSIGILGLVGLQAKMTKSATSAKARGEAAYLAQQVIGTAWADRPNLPRYATANCSTYGPCTDWLNRVKATLPSGDGEITVTAATGLFAVRITWTAPDEPQHNFTTTTTITP